MAHRLGSVEYVYEAETLSIDSFAGQSHVRGPITCAQTNHGVETQLTLLH